MKKPLSRAGIVLRICIPLLVFGLFESIWLIKSSETSPEGRVLGLVCLFLGILLPTAIVMTSRSHRIFGFVIATASVVASMLLYDSKSYLVAGKMEPFQILNYMPYGYLIGFVLMTALIYFTAFVSRFAGDKVELK